MPRPHGGPFFAARCAKIEYTVERHRVLTAAQDISTAPAPTGTRSPPSGQGGRSGGGWESDARARLLPGICGVERESLSRIAPWGLPATHMTNNILIRQRMEGTAVNDEIVGGRS